MNVGKGVILMDALAEATKIACYAYIGATTEV
jgi:hypothetical protein